jgi:3-dehydroquinate synthetase
MIMIAPVKQEETIQFKLVAGAPTETEIILGVGVLQQAPMLLERHRGSKLILVTDDQVKSLYAEPLCDLLKAADFQAQLISIPAGEKAKTLETVYELYGACHDLHVSRRDVVIAVGGGMVGDVAGMLAGTYLRGLELIQAPTSLLAMLSSSFGGKGGVNFRGYKSLIGLFKNPSIVMADLSTLESLSRSEYLSGLGELITVGVLGAHEIFEEMERRGDADLLGLIGAAIRYKMSVVRADPYDQLDIRAKLHLGHNFSHAFERLSDFTLPHGLAVAVGLSVASQLASEMGLCSRSLADRVRTALASIGLPTGLTGYSPKEVIQAIREKGPNGKLRLILPVEIGEVTFVDEEHIPIDLLESILQNNVCGKGNEPESISRL